MRRDASPPGRLTRRRGVGLSLAALVLFGLSPGCDRGPTPPATSPPPRPNIIVICTDDQAPRMMGYEGNPHARTPNIDRLAAEGTHFTRAYVPLPQCAPSRAALLSGNYPSTTGVMTNIRARLDPKKWPSFAQTLKQHGYRCGLVGKWHLSEPNRPQAGFGEFWVALDLDAPIERHYRDPPLFIGTGKKDGRGNWATERKEERGYATDVLTDYAIRFIDENTAEPDKPFLLCLNYKSPHAPHETSPDPRFKFDPATLPLPVSCADDLSTKPVQQRRSTAHRVYKQTSPEALREELARYYSMIASIDANVGRVMDHLDQRGLRDKTLIVYMSDNGVLMGEHQMIEKDCNFYEEQVRTPLIFHWPGQIPAARCDTLVSALDLYPTLARLAGASDLPPLGGIDLWPLIKQGARPSRDVLFFEYLEKAGTDELEPMLGCVTNGHKYVRYLTGGEELYDLANDPYEMKNLADGPDAIAELERHRKLVLNYLRTIKQPFWE